MTRDEHLMTIAMEEAVEVALVLTQRISKALRFGMEQIQEDADDKPEENPERLTNRERIRKEYSDLAAMLEMIGIGAPLGRDMDAKREKVERYLLRSQRCGTLAGPDGRLTERPLLRCTRCYRWEYSAEGEVDQMPQPDGSECGGIFAGPDGRRAPDWQAEVHCECGHSKNVHPFGLSEALSFDGRCVVCRCERFRPVAAPPERSEP